MKFKTFDEQIRKEKLELKKAESDPGYIQMQLQIEECAKLIGLMNWIKS